MKRFLTILFVLTFAVSAYAGDPHNFGWTLSNSPTDELANTGTFAAGILTLYLHYACTADAQGLASAEFDISSSSAANIVLAFTPMNGFLNAGGATNLLLAVGGCPLTTSPGGSIAAGSFLISANAPGQYCIVLSAANSLNVSVNCVELDTFDNDYIGYADDGGQPCFEYNDHLCNPVAVESSSWGAVKSLYR